MKKQFMYDYDLSYLLIYIFALPYPARETTKGKTS